MNDTNKHGLKRFIPAVVRRSVRRRCKFGCVVCRSGFYQYHHVAPAFQDATAHVPSGICCLCPSCHSRVTNHQLSHEAVLAAYTAIQSADPATVGAPVGPLDFHGGAAELLIGGIAYVPSVQTILRYHGESLVSVRPSNEKRPASISAEFTDDFGRTTMSLHNNEWEGAVNAWDIEVVGRSLTVRSGARRIALHLVLEPPGRIVVERLDMRIRDSHVLISRTTSAIGRYINETDVFWLHASVDLLRGSEAGAAIEFASPALLEKRFERQKTSGGQYMTDGRGTVIGNETGAAIIPAGLSIGPMCGAIAFRQMAHGTRRVSEVRDVLFHTPDQVAHFIGTGKTGYQT